MPHFIRANRSLVSYPSGLARNIYIALQMFILVTPSAVLQGTLLRNYLAEPNSQTLNISSHIFNNKIRLILICYNIFPESKFYLVSTSIEKFLSIATWV